MDHQPASTPIQPATMSVILFYKYISIPQPEKLREELASYQQIVVLK